MDNQTFDDVLGAFAEIDKIVKRLKSENAQLEEDKKNLIRADKKKSDHIDELEEEVKELKRCWSIEIETCNRYREKWEKILYEHVPSKAFNKYQKAFERHDEERFNNFVNDKPEQIKSTTLFPADIYKGFTKGNDAKVIEAQWKNLPNYIDSDKTFLPIIDVSGSMYGGYGSSETGITPIMNSIALGLYLAERNKSIFKNAFMSFSSTPKMHYIEGDSVVQKFKYIKDDPTMGYSTDIQAAFDLILKSALDNHLTREDLPDYVLILSDMEFNDPDVRGYKTNFEMIKRKFSMNNLDMPNLIFWNLNGRIGNVLVTINDDGVALVSGYSPAIMKSVLTSKVVTPYDVMKETLDLPRYKCIV